MKLTVRQRAVPPAPGLRGRARVDRRTRHLLDRLRPGDIAVIDQLDLDRSTAISLVDRGAAAVLNAGPMFSGRYPSLGPQVLVEAGIPVLDGLGTGSLSRIRDGVELRVDGGGVYVGEELAAEGRVLTPAHVRAEMDLARSGMVAQLESFTHNSVEFLRREEDLLLHGRGLPRLATSMSARPVVVVVEGHDHRAELRGILGFIREQHPVLVGVDGGADVLAAAGHRPDVVVVSGVEPAPSAAVARTARDLVVVVPRGGGRTALDSFERMGLRPLGLETGATSEDAALLLADAADASLIVGVGMHATLEEFLDRRRAGLASTYLTRLRIGPRLVDGAAVPALYSGRLRPRHLLAVGLAGLVALGAAIGVTPVGQEWATELLAAVEHDLLPALDSATDSVIDTIRGFFE